MSGVAGAARPLTLTGAGCQQRQISPALCSFMPHTHCLVALRIRHKRLNPSFTRHPPFGTAIARVRHGPQY